MTHSPLQDLRHGILARVALLGESLWREHFAGDVAVIGHGLLIDGQVAARTGLLLTLLA